jgi:hypothetical protein
MSQTYKPVTPSDALRYLMHTQRDELMKLKGGEPQGKCIDCKRQVPAHEIAVKCENCNYFVCVNCIDKHDHMHEAFKKMGLRVN